MGRARENLHTSYSYCHKLMYSISTHIQLYFSTMGKTGIRGGLEMAKTKTSFPFLDQELVETLLYYL